MSNQPLLTVAIPTYNRPKQLGQTLLRLLPQINDNWILHIHDNCSDQPVAECQAEILAQFGSGRVRVFRNVVNIGLCGNILRGFEHAVTPWLSILADDDEIAPDYLAAVLQAIGNHPDMVFATFSSTIFARPADFVTDGLADFCARMDNWSNLLFLPCGLYNRLAMVPHLRHGYIYAYSLGPQIAILLQCLKENGGKCFFSSRKVVTFVSPEDVVSWSRLNLNVMALLLELIPDRAGRLAFYDQMRPYFMNRRELAFQLIHRAKKTGEDATCIFDVRAFCQTCFRPNLRGLFVHFFLRYLVAHPRLGLKFIRFSGKFSSQAEDKDTAAELFKGI